MKLCSEDTVSLSMYFIPSTAASAPAMVVKVVTRASKAEVRMARESAMALRRSSTVLITMQISSFLIMSTICGRPSRTLFTRLRRRPAAVISFVRALRWPRCRSPRATRRRAISTAPALSRSRTPDQHAGLRGSTVPEAACALA